jgi:hypothetical protein
MDRHNTLHKASRVELPAGLPSFADPCLSEFTMSTTRPVLSKLGEVLGKLGVLTCALAVVATASVIAMHIR